MIKRSANKIETIPLNFIPEESDQLTVLRINFSYFKIY